MRVSIIPAQVQMLKENNRVSFMAKIKDSEARNSLISQLGDNFAKMACLYRKNSNTEIIEIALYITTELNVVDFQYND